LLDSVVIVSSVHPGWFIGLLVIVVVIISIPIPSIPVVVVLIEVIGWFGFCLLHFYDF
jgi:hypothetical protein